MWVKIIDVDKIESERYSLPENEDWLPGWTEYVVQFSDGLSSSSFSRWTAPQVALLLSVKLLNHKIL